jgi:hypothetical protein
MLMKQLQEEWVISVTSESGLFFLKKEPKTLALRGF